MPTDSISSPLLRSEQAARYLGLSNATLEKWRLTGGGPRFSRLGRAVVYRREELDAFVQSHKAGSTSERRAA